MLKVVERQMASWNLKRRLEDLGQRPGRYLADDVAYGPCLLVSRECGSGGGRLARLAGQRLGWQVFDREILDQIAQLAQVRVQLLASVDERTRAIWGDGWRPELAPEDVGWEPYLRYLRQVVMTLGHQGDVVILGRGAAFLLPSRCALRVRVVAPVASRVQRVAEGARLSPEEAQRYVLKFDADRADFIRKSFQREAGSPQNYDLVINTGEIGLEAALELVLAALRHKLGVQATGAVRRR